MPSFLPTGTVTFLFTDIEDSTGLAQRYPDEMPSLLAQHHTILRQSIETNKGHIFQIAGDGFCAAFFTAGDALHAALEAQRHLQQTEWHPAAIKVRMGVNTGPAQAGTSEDASGGYSGYLTLTRTQRVMSTAFGGQVLISSASAELLRAALPEGVDMRDLGEHRLKGLLNPERLWQVSAPDLPSEFPVLSSLDGIPNNLPVQLNRFIGREHELAQTKDLLATTHLLTLIGPGGTGKTRLSLQLAAEVLPEFEAGAWLVELAPLADPALVLPTIAATLSLREIPGTSLKDIVTQFLYAKHLLLVLDNCEHLVESCAKLADHFLRNCTNLKIIASSREALGITGESIYRVPPLALPEADSLPVETLSRSEAIQLFVERAAAVKPGFGLNEQNAGVVAQICRRLDGIPLALELAAARVGMLTPHQIATRLDDRFRLLTGGSRTALPRQQTLRSLIDWSYDLLSEPERLLFRQLAVFVGGWPLEAAEAVCPELDVFGLLTQLVQKSLVAVDDVEGRESTRFRLLETIRQYARDRLFEMEAAAQVRDRHLVYYLNFVEAGEQYFYGPRRLEWINQCELEHDNFRAALQWGLEHDVEAALRLDGSLVTFWAARGFIAEGRRWLQAGLDHAAALPEGEAGHKRQAVLAKAYSGACQLSYGDGDYQTGLATGQAAVRIYRQLGDQIGLGFALCNTGAMAAFQGDTALAEQVLEEAFQIGRELGNKSILTFALGVLSRYVCLPRGDIALASTYNEEAARLSQETGSPWAVGQCELIRVRIAAILGQWDESRTHILLALEIYQELRDPVLLSMAYLELGDLELRSGNLLEALRTHQQCIVAFQEVGQRAGIIHELESIAVIAHRSGQPGRAARLCGTAEALREAIGVSLNGIERLTKEYNGTLTGLHDQLDEASFQAHWAQGRAMSMNQAISYALEA